MIFHETAVSGAWLIEPERLEDERGFFARTWDAREFEERGLNPRLVQCSIASTKARGTLRGLHYQAAPHQEAKLVRCFAGSIFDLAVDLRPDSPTFRGWHGAVLSSDNLRALYVPEGCAHGFLTLTDDCDVLYQISEWHAPESAKGVRWNDPAFGIRLPRPVLVVNERDRSYPDFELPAVEAPS